MSNASDIKVFCELRLNKLGNLITTRVKGQLITENLRLEEIQMLGDDEWLYAVIKVSGRHNGSITARFKLSTYADVSGFNVEHLNVRITEGGGLLAKGANFVMRHLLGEKIETKVQKKIHDIIEQQITEMTSRYSIVDLGEGMKLRSELDAYNFEHIEWDDSELRIVLTTVATVKLELK